eukprot:m.86379 g.86379  ORF g.86379 m.86379 type:complete len:82 (-) comp8757_c3_seq2:54-299(-)
MGRRESTDILSSNEVDRIQRSSLERINKSGRSLYDVLCCNQEDDDLALKTSYRKVMNCRHWTIENRLYYMYGHSLPTQPTA